MSIVDRRLDALGGRRSGTVVNTSFLREDEGGRPPTESSNEHLLVMFPPPLPCLLRATRALDRRFSLHNHGRRKKVEGRTYEEATTVLAELGLCWRVCLTHFVDGGCFSSLFFLEAAKLCAVACVVLLSASGRRAVLFFLLSTRAGSSDNTPFGREREAGRRPCIKEWTRDSWSA